MDIEDIEFEKALVARRHTDLTEALAKINAALSTKPDDGLKNAIEKLAVKISHFLTIEKEDKSEDKIVLSISGMKESILQGLDAVYKAIELQQQPKKWIHTVTKRNYGGFVEEITSTQITKL